jgi:hypothetical protein
VSESLFPPASPASTAPPELPPKAPKKKRSTVRHTRAIQRDRSKRPTAGPPGAEIEAHLAELVQPAVYAQVAAYQALGLRHRLLTLPVMVAFVLRLLWRHLGSVGEAVRVLRQEGVLWTPPLHVSSQAVNQRLRSLPPTLFEGVLRDVLPVAHARWQARTAAGERPLPPVLVRARRHFGAILAVDGSTLDALLRKVGLLRQGGQGEGPVLAGRMAALLDVAAGLPRQVWYEADSQAHDQRFWDRILLALEADTLLLFDLGFLNHALFDRLTDAGIALLTRLKANATCRVERVLTWGPDTYDQLVWLGSSETRCVHLMRVVGVRHAGTWYRYLTNVLDPARLPATDVAALYACRWGCEDAFNGVKRLLGLAYFYVGAANAVQTQLWATWLLYAVLVDLTDAVAAALHRPFATISLEMVYRGLYHFTQAIQRGQAAATDPVTYLATNASWLGLLKRPRRRPSTQLSHLTASPDP